jgi:carboxyl-terminal processing protease
MGVVLLIGSFGLGIVVGQSLLVKQAGAETEDVSGLPKALIVDRSINGSDTVEFRQFWEVWDRIKTKYVTQPVSETDLFYGAMQGLVYGLKDPYSVFLPPQAATEFTKSLSGELSGIGAEIGLKNNDLVVVAPLPDTPAEKAGLRPGDKIIGIDELSAIGMTVETAVQHIRGSATSSVKLTIMREGVQKPIEMTIHRAKINVPAVIMTMKPGNVAHLRVMQFNDRTIPQFDKAISDLKAKKVTGIILDLRNNPGGYLDAAVTMASEWVKSGKIVSEKFNGGNENTHETEGDHRLVGIKTVVLINGGSASASEIVAGALQDHKVATLVGEKSFGKGSVQDYETFGDGSALKITVAEWHTPNGGNINHTGIKPDVEVKEDFSKEKIGEDLMIDKALEILKK